MAYSNTVTYTCDPAEWEDFIREVHGTGQGDSEIASHPDSAQEGLPPITAQSLPPLPDAD